MNRHGWTACAVFAGALPALLFVDAPAPPLFAAMLASAAYAVRSGQTVEVPRTLRDVGMATVGVTAGASIDAGVMQLIGSRPVTVLGGVLSTLVLTLLIGQLLRLSPGLSGYTAAFASVAGGASGVSLMAREFGADDGVVLLVQYLRVVIVLLSVPLVAPLLGDAGSAVAGSNHASRPADYGFFLVAGLLGLVVARMMRFTAAEILLPLLAASGLAMWGGFGDVVIPEWLAGVGYGLLGLSVGFRFTLDRLRRMVKHLPIAILQIFLGIAACAGAGLVFAHAVGVSPLDGYLATSPGGLAAVIAVAVDSGGEVGLILTMQFVRVFLALVLAPLIGAVVRRAGGAADSC